MNLFNRQKSKEINFKKLVEKSETAEELFDIYEESRDLKDLYPLYDINILLHELRSDNTTRERSEITTLGKSLVKMYDKINGRFIFTKILVY